jgi:hypothetical protein
MDGILPDEVAAGLLLIMAAAALAGWQSRWRQLSGTTLRAACYWSLAALAALLLATTTSSVHLRYVATVATFCPLVSILGAKRPQDRAWQFIVAALWLVLALPGLQQLLSRGGVNLDLHAAWQWFLAILILLGLFNGLPTRLWPSSLLTALAQTLMLLNQLPLPLEPSAANIAQAWQAGVLIWWASAALWGFDQPRRRDLAGWDRVWLDFRDLVGAIWAIRVAERINAAARLCGWKSHLKWGGFVPIDQSTLEPALQRSFRMVLRRFVSPDWIDRRLIERSYHSPPRPPD